MANSSNKASKYTHSHGYEIVWRIAAYLVTKQVNIPILVDWSLYDYFSSYVLVHTCTNMGLGAYKYKTISRI